MIKENKKEDISFLKIMSKVIPMAFWACPVYFIVWNVVSIFHGVSHGFNTFMTQKLFDVVTEGVNKGGTSQRIILWAIALGLALILCQILNGVGNFMFSNQEKMMVRHVGKKINEKAGRLDPIAFEDTKYLDDINKANEGMLNSGFLVFIITSIFTFYLPYFLFMAIYLYSLKPILALSLILIFIPVALTQLIRVKVFGKLADESAPIRREYEYYERCIVDREYYKETRLLGAFKYFKDIYILSLNLLNKKIWSAERKSNLIELGMKIITLLGYVGVLYLLFDSLIKGDISPGAFGAIFSSIGLMFGIMEEIICRHIGAITRNIGTVKNLVRFLDMPERSGEEIKIQGIPNISIQDVSFSYPGSDRKSLNGINLEVKSGETIAIVGENGAGKTTLVKLITGLYLPTEGKVFIGGADTSKVSIKSLYENISGVFQKYQRYKMTLEENIEISSLNNKGQLTSEDKKEAIQKAAVNADLEIGEEKFPEGYETMLSREFDGVDLSGGQWQRIAIARGFYRGHNMIVLDEPTAAIDPVEETKIYSKFAEMSKGNTSIIVTHRLGSAKIADRIIVMDKGGIAEIGTHEELIENMGKYAEMYNAQSKWYVDEAAASC